MDERNEGVRIAMDGYEECLIACGLVSTTTACACGEDYCIDLLLLRLLLRLPLRLLLRLPLRLSLSLGLLLLRLLLQLLLPLRQLLLPLRQLLLPLRSSPFLLVFFRARIAHLAKTMSHLFTSNALVKIVTSSHCTSKPNFLINSVLYIGVIIVFFGFSVIYFCRALYCSISSVVRSPP